jgi:hypothetical protein
MLALMDSVGLDVAEAKETMLDTVRWILTGALADLAGDGRSSSARAR